MAYFIAFMLVDDEVGTYIELSDTFNCAIIINFNG